MATDILFHRHEFYQWVFQNAQDVWKACKKLWPGIPLLFALASALTLPWTAPGTVNRLFKDSKQAEVTVQLFHAVVALIISFAVSRKKPRRLFATGLAEVRIISADRFWHFWHIWWLLLFVLYIGLAAKAAFTPSFEALFNFILNILVSLSAVCLLLCYLTLEQPTEDPQPSHRYIWLFFVVAMIVNFGTTFRLDMAGIRDIIYHPWPQLSFMLVIGLATGVSFALLIGRFESKFLGAPQLVLVFLYIYSVIQATYGLFNSRLYFLGTEISKQADTTAHNVRITISIATLILKLLFFALVTWFITEGRLILYLENAPRLVKEIDRTWRTIKAKAANFQRRQQNDST